jgi:hypothetical protein
VNRNAARLADFAARKNVTFIVGAGVSKSRGVPTWRDLTRNLWRHHVGPRGRLPGWLDDHWEALQKVRAMVEASHGREFAHRLAIGDPHPLADQMALELLARRFARDDTPRGGHDAFVARLRSLLYPPQARVVRRRTPDTLSVLGRILREDQRRPSRSITRVISFNADDHLENEANGGRSPKRRPVAWPVARESSHVRLGDGAHSRPPIPVYHPHGFLPRERDVMLWQEASDTLVFTDAQYWASVASPMSFANRVLGNALHDSVCVFIGVSMKDVNLVRWLGVRYHAIVTDKASQHAVASRKGRGPRNPERSRRSALERHFWIRPPSDDPDSLIGELLHERGVLSVEIDGWGAPFTALMAECFPSKRLNARG